MKIDGTVGFVGTGNMAEALIRGLVESKMVEARQIVASHPREERRLELATRYGIEAVTLPTCINQRIPEFTTPPALGSPIRIAYSGNVNETRLDPLRALVRAVGSDPAYAIHYFTPQTREFYSLERLWGDAERIEVPDEPGRAHG